MVYKTTISELGDDEVYTSLQKKLDEIRDLPSKDTERGDQIVGLLELTARVQGRLFEALNEEGVPDRKVLPLMASGRLGMPTHKVSENTELKLIKDNLNKTRELEETRRSATIRQLALEKDLDLEKTTNKLSSKKNDQLLTELSVANRQILETTRRLDQTSAELKDTKLDNALMKTAPSSLYRYWDKYYPYSHYYPYSDYVPYRYRSLYYPYSYGYPYYSYADARYWRTRYDEEYAKLKVDLALAKSDTKALTATAARTNDLVLGDLTNDARRRRLIDRYADLFTGERLYVMKALRAKISDEDIIKRIVYTSVVETFRSSQRSFREFRHRARRAVTLGSVLPTVEADVQAYIVRNLDLYDSDSTVFEVVRHLNADPLLPNTVDYKQVLRTLITEVGKVAFEMQSVFPTLDIESGYQGEVFSEDKFRRTFDAEFSAPLIGAHLWPPLVNAEDNSVVLKGECATRHSPFASTTGRFKETDYRKSKRGLASGKGTVGRSTHRQTSRARSASPIRGRQTRARSPVKN